MTDHALSTPLPRGNLLKIEHNAEDPSPLAPFLEIIKTAHSM